MPGWLQEPHPNPNPNLNWIKAMEAAGLVRRSSRADSIAEAEAEAKRRAAEKEEARAAAQAEADRVWAEREKERRRLKAIADTKSRAFGVPTHDFASPEALKRDFPSGTNQCVR